jgi:hypothetical protein
MDDRRAIRFVRSDGVSASVSIWSTQDLAVAISPAFQALTARISRAA